MVTAPKPLLVLCSIFMLVLTVSFAQAQSATQPVGAPPATQSVAPVPAQTATTAANSATQLKLDRPLLGMQLMQPSNSPNFYQDITLGGGDLNVSLGGTCVAGYTNALAALGMVWTGDSGAVEIGFNATSPAVPTAMIMWDVIKQQWWCSQQFSQGNYLQFTNLPQGIYFVWATTQTSQTVQGDVFVRATPSQ